MREEPNAVRAERRPALHLDDRDRMLSGLLSEDATLSYAELGKRISLSAAAVHERVKRLRRDGVIKATVATLNGAAIGRPLLAFIHVDATGWGARGPFLDMDSEPDVEEVHTVARDACLILKVRCVDAQGLEDLLARIYAIEGVRSTRSYIALFSYLERGPQAQIGD